jgi:hypothetical protein
VPDGCSVGFAALAERRPESWHLLKKSLVIKALTPLHGLGTALDLHRGGDAGRGRELLHGNRTVLSAPFDAAPGRARGRSIT